MRREARGKKFKNSIPVAKEFQGKALQLQYGPHCSQSSHCFNLAKSFSKVYCP